MVKSSGKVTIKKYANRRLYDTESSAYITLDRLAQMVREGREFEVVDAKTGEDITRQVLTQIIVDEESRGATMLPLAVFDVDAVVDLIERERISMLPGPPTLYHSLLTVGDKAKLATLRAGVTGAADIPVELVRRVLLAGDPSVVPFGP